MTCQANVSSGNTSISFTPFLTNPNVLLKEARPTLPSRRCTAAKVEPKMFLLPQSPGANIDNLGVAFADVVLRPFAFINEKPNFLPNEREITT